MSAAMTVFTLQGDAGGMFDGSVNGISVLKSTNARVLPGDGGIALDRGAIDIARHPDLDGLAAFTIEASITPANVGGARQNIVEGQTPPIALFIDAGGKLAGAVQTAAGWLSVDSGTTLIAPATTQRVTFTRDANGATQLAIDGRSVGSATAPGPLQNAGALGLRVGLGMDGASLPFAGTITNLSIRQGVVTQEFFAERTAEELAAGKSGAASRQHQANFGPLAAGRGSPRLQHVKDMMNAAGVETVSDLGTLPVRQRTSLNRGQVLVAPRKNSVPR